jgi:hypothetical protein
MTRLRRRAQRAPGNRPLTQRTAPAKKPSATSSSPTSTSTAKSGACGSTRRLARATYQVLGLPRRASVTC